MTLRAPGSPWARRLFLAALVVLAAALRFDGLDWGLRHPPNADERVFVRNAGLMLAAGDLDHRYYEYPGLFVYLLAGTLTAVHASDGAPAYLAGRALVALFGVVSVFLAYRLGRQQAGAACGLLAAALLAVSPIEVRTAHMIRPDVVLEAFVLLGLLLQGRVGEGRPRTLASGAALGAATAVKFTGALLAPSLALRLLAVGRARLATLALAALASLAAFVLLSPYTLLGQGRAVSGAGLQFGFFFLRRPADGLGGFLVQARYFYEALGAAGLALAVAGAVAAARAWRAWIHVLALPAVFVLVFSTTTFRAERYILPCLGAVAVLAAFGAQAVWTRWPRAVLPLALAALAQPAADTLRYLSDLRQPRTQDLAADWLGAHVPPGSRLLVPADVALGLPAGLEQVLVRRLDLADPRLGADFDAVVSPGNRSVVGQVAGRTLFEATPTTPQSGPLLRILAPLRPAVRAVEAGSISLRFSDGEDTAPLADGDLATRVRLTEPVTLDVVLAGPRRLRRAELVTPDRDEARAEIEVLVRRPGAAAWRPAGVLEGRPALEEQWGVASRLLLFDGDPVEALRLRLRPRRRAFGLAELRLGFEPDGPAL